MFFRKKKERPTLHGWVIQESGLEKTESRLLIEQSLAHLKTRRVMLVLEQKSNPAAPTMLLGYNDKDLMLDAPPGWKPRSQQVRLRYQDSTSLECFFDTRIQYLKSGVIHLRLPDHLLRLQRRAHYRIDVPTGSEAVAGEAESRTRLTIRNISAGGMLCCSKKPNLAPGKLLKDLELRLVLMGSDNRSRKLSQVRVEQGRIVRTFTDRESGHFCYGVAFEAGSREEGELLQYVRQREIQLARMGTAS